MQKDFNLEQSLCVHAVEIAVKETFTNVFPLSYIWFSNFNCNKLRRVMTGYKIPLNMEDIWCHWYHIQAGCENISHMNSFNNKLLFYIGSKLHPEFSSSTQVHWFIFLQLYWCFSFRDNNNMKPNIIPIITLLKVNSIFVCQHDSVYGLWPI